MVACKTVGEYKQKQEKLRKFCLEVKAEQARQQEARAKQARSAPLQTAAVPQTENVINTQPLGHAEVVAMARKNQRAQKRPLIRRKQSMRQPTRQAQKPQQQQVKPKIPGDPQKTPLAKGRKSSISQAIHLIWLWPKNKSGRIAADEGKWD